MIIQDDYHYNDDYYDYVRHSFDDNCLDTDDYIEYVDHTDSDDHDHSYYVENSDDEQSLKSLSIMNMIAL